jgi:50S ribosomal protein L16 3-hydroxylase
VFDRKGAARFLAEHWQKEPCVIRAAFRDFKDPLTADELAGLACEPHVDSRLVLQRGGRRPWEVRRGPQSEASLRKLPRSHWTLLVESVDRYSKEIADLASAFPFLPTWRMDDVMVSLSPVHGTVDAHIDSYDVFLIQGPGRRRWEVDRKAVPDYRPGLDLRILKRFRAEDSWILDPGDVLYVPPGVAHRGVTVPSSSKIALTYSVGFRAPSSADLLSALAARGLAKETPELFADRGRRPARGRFELSSTDLDDLHRFLVQGLRAKSDDWVLAAGEAVTSGRQTILNSIRRSPASLVRELSGGAHLAPVPGVRMSWSKLAQGRAAIFVNGESRVLSSEAAFAAPFLCGQASKEAAQRAAANPEVVSVAVALFRAGVLSLQKS